MFTFQSDWINTRLQNYTATIYKLDNIKNIQPTNELVNREMLETGSDPQASKGRSRRVAEERFGCPFRWNYFSSIFRWTNSVFLLQ